MAAPVIPSDFAYQSAVDRCSQQAQARAPDGRRCHPCERGVPRSGSCDGPRQQWDRSSGLAATSTVWRRQSMPRPRQVRAWPQGPSKSGKGRRELERGVITEVMDNPPIEAGSATCRSQRTDNSRRYWVERGPGHTIGDQTAPLQRELHRSGDRPPPRPRIRGRRVDPRDPETIASM